MIMLHFLFLCLESTIRRVEWVREREKEIDSKWYKFFIVNIRRCRSSLLRWTIKLNKQQSVHTQTSHLFSCGDGVNNHWNIFIRRIYITMSVRCMHIAQAYRVLCRWCDGLLETYITVDLSIYNREECIKWTDKWKNTTKKETTTTVDSKIDCYLT